MLRRQDAVSGLEDGPQLQEFCFAGRQCHHFYLSKLSLALPSRSCPTWLTHSLVPAKLPADLAKAILFTASRLTDIRDSRKVRLVHWRRRAEALREKTLDFISQVQDDGLRHFFQRDFPCSPEPRIRDFPHFFLWREMLSAIDSSYVGLCNAMESGFKLLGPIERSHVLEPFDNPYSSVFAEEELTERAWRIRQQVKKKLMRKFSAEQQRTLQSHMVSEHHRRRKGLLQGSLLLRG